jgi:glycosyltransferase involved in cell wall biosynthesis
VRVRIAYVCRDLASSRLTGPGARTFSTASAMAAAGHDVHLLSESLAAPRARALAAGHGLQWTRVRETRPQHRYFTEQHAYADRVYDTLAKLHNDEAFDIVEFSSATAEALTSVRAKRLLGEFAATALLVRIGAEIEALHFGRRALPLTFEQAVNNYAHQYVRTFADGVFVDALTGHDALDIVGRTPQLAPFVANPSHVPTLRIPEVDAAHTIWHLGDLTPQSGIATFLDAAELMLATEPRLTFYLAGDDTLSDPFGRSYWAYLQPRLSRALRDAVTMVGPLVDARQLMPRVGNQCVIATASPDAPSGVVLAMAHGCAVTVREGSAAAAFVEPGVSAAVVERDDPASLASALLRVMSDPEHAARLSRAALYRTATRCRPEQVATAMTSVYEQCRAETASRPAPATTTNRELVSVVIPLYNQGSYVLGTIDSVRASTYHDVEIVVVDDGSTDEATIDIFDSLEGVTKVRQRNSGLSAARNAGIAAASGRYIVPLDSDDMLPAGFIAAAVSALQRNADLGYVAGYLRYFGLLDYTHVPAGYIPHISLVVNTHVRATALFRRDALTDIGGYDVGLPAFEDWDLHVRLALAGHTSDIVPVEGHMYRRHAESMTFSSSNAMRLELLQHVMAKHLASIDHEHVAGLLLLMAHLWKTGFEPSASVRLQQELQQSIVLPDTESADARADVP